MRTEFDNRERGAGKAPLLGLARLSDDARKGARSGWPCRTAGGLRCSALAVVAAGRAQSRWSQQDACRSLPPLVNKPKKSGTWIVLPAGHRKIRQTVLAMHRCNLKRASAMSGTEFQSKEDPRQPRTFGKERQKTLRLLLCLFVFIASARASDVAVSIRYLHAQGKSHAAIFLFDGQGKLVRQLTKPGEDQDFAPVFSPDGNEIVFRRGHSEEDAKKLFIVDRQGKKTRAIEGESPAWYGRRVVAKPFGDSDSLDTEPETKDAVRTFASPDGTLALVLKPNPFLREKKGPLQPLAEMPGFSVFWYVRLDHGSPFLIMPKLRVAFFGGEELSTLGNTIYALDVDRKRIVKLSNNGAVAYPWPGQGSFFAVASSRYEPLGDGRTVNCSYLDWYHATMKRTRFGHALGKYGGASVFIAGEQPFTIPYLEFNN